MGFVYSSIISDLFSRHLELHWLSEARICASEHRVHTLFNLRSYCETIEDQLFSRAFINAVYRALVEGFALFPRMGQGA